MPELPFKLRSRRKHPEAALAQNRLPEEQKADVVLQNRVWLDRSRRNSETINLGDCKVFIGYEYALPPVQTLLRTGIRPKAASRRLVIRRTPRRGPDWRRLSLRLLYFTGGVLTGLALALPAWPWRP